MRADPCCQHGGVADLGGRLEGGGCLADGQGEFAGETGIDEEVVQLARRGCSSPTGPQALMFGQILEYPQPRFDVPARCGATNKHPPRQRLPDTGGAPIEAPAGDFEFG